MTNDEEPDIETQPAAGDSGNYKKWLFNVLRQEFKGAKGKMLQTTEYRQYEYINSVLDAGIRIIESKSSKIGIDHAFNNIF